MAIILHMILTYLYIPSSCCSWNNVEFYGYLTTLLICDNFVPFYRITPQSSILQRWKIQCC